MISHCTVIWCSHNNDATLNYEWESIKKQKLIVLVFSGYFHKKMQRESFKKMYYLFWKLENQQILHSAIPSLPLNFVIQFFSWSPLYNPSFLLCNLSPCQPQMQDTSAVVCVIVLSVLLSCVQGDSQTTTEILPDFRSLPNTNYQCSQDIRQVIILQFLELTDSASKPNP